MCNLASGGSKFSLPPWIQTLCSWPVSSLTFSSFSSLGSLLLLPAFHLLCQETEPLVLWDTKTTGQVYHNCLELLYLNPSCIELKEEQNVCTCVTRIHSRVTLQALWHTSFDCLSCTLSLNVPVLIFSFLLIHWRQVMKLFCKMKQFNSFIYVFKFVEG